MKSAKRKTIMIEGVRYYAERPHDCRKCFFWENRNESVPNAELKEMVEAYKTRSPQKRKAGSRETPQVKFPQNQSYLFFKSSI